MKTPYLSICIPTHDMPNGDFFLERLQHSLEAQTFTDFEVVMTKEGKMAENSNAAIKKAKGELVKILYMDDYLAHENSLQEIVDNFKGEWLVTGCDHDNGIEHFNPHYALYSDSLKEGNNTIGSPSVLTMRRSSALLFDEQLTWVLDCDLYVRLYEAYGPPIILDTINVTIGVGGHQTTYALSDELKCAEQDYLVKKNV
jgi:hypothetical protein